MVIGWFSAWCMDNLKRFKMKNILSTALFVVLFALPLMAFANNVEVFKGEYLVVVSLTLGIKKGTNV